MDIALVTETFEPFKGGSAKRYLEVFKRLSKKGFNIDVYTVRLKPSWLIHEEIEGLNVYRTETVLRNFITGDGFRSVREVLIYTYWVYKSLRDKDYDLIEANHCPIFPTFPSKLYSIFKNVPLSITFHEVWYDHWYRYVPNKVYAPLGIILEKTMSKLPDAYISVSEYTSSRLINLLKIDADKVYTIPNGVDLNLYESIDVDRDSTRIIYLGRLNPHKRLEDLLNAMKIVVKRYSDVRLDVVGDGPMRRVYESYVNSNGLKKHVVFYGSLSDAEVVRMLKSSYVYVLPSIREGQSITTLEAMAAGTPQIIVNSDGSGARYLIEEAGSGFTVDPSPYSIAEAIMRILDDRSLWLKFHRNSISYVRYYTWDRAAEEHYKLYRNLA